MKRSVYRFQILAGLKIPSVSKIDLKFFSALVFITFRAILREKQRGVDFHSFWRLETYQSWPLVASTETVFGYPPTYDTFSPPPPFCFSACCVSLEETGTDQANRHFLRYSKTGSLEGALYGTFSLLHQNRTIRSLPLSIRDAEMTE